MKILITGGAGFIGTWTARACLERGHAVTVLDNLEPMAHPEPYTPPEGASFIRGDVTQHSAFKGLDPDVVIHLAARVSVPHSMQTPHQYVLTNSMGTAVLLECLGPLVDRVVVASSMSIYGEGSYLCPACGRTREPQGRERDRLDMGLWDHICPVCASNMEPIPTGEEAPARPRSVYAASKLHQEQMVRLWCAAHGTGFVSLRYFNVYGPGQTLSNPYTGVVSIFTSRILAGRSPILFEDGRQLRDYVYVEDVARANLMAAEGRLPSGTYNVASGRATEIREIAEAIAEVANSEIRPVVPGEYRMGDTRHCWGDITRIKEAGWVPVKDLMAGLDEMVAWAKEVWVPEMERQDSVIQGLRRSGIVVRRRNRPGSKGVQGVVART